MEMSVGVLDHYNVSTRSLKETVEFYESVLGFKNGPRPPFNFPGAWLYSGDHPVLCVVKAAKVSVSVTVFPEIDCSLAKYFAVRRDLLQAQRLMLGLAAQSLSFCPDRLVQHRHGNGRLRLVTEGEVSRAWEFHHR